VGHPLRAARRRLGNVRPRVVVYIGCVVVAAAGVQAALNVAHEARKAARDAEQAIATLEDQRERAEARTCVTSWDVRQGIREGMALTADIAPTALIVAAGADADQAAVDLLVTTTDQLTEQAIAKVPLPTCDLAEATRRLDRPRVNGG
jgi:hypothetical protein